MKKVAILCSNGTDLGLKLADKMDIQVADVETRRFPDEEIYFRVDSDLKGKEAIIIQGGYPDPNASLVELMLAVDTCSHLKAKKVTVVVPYFPYGRQDQRFKDGEAFSLEVAAKTLKTLGADKLVTVDAHFKRDYGKHDLFGIESYNISAGTALAKYIKKKYKIGKLQIISPDFGASEMISTAAKETKSDAVKMKKVRKGDFEVEVTGKMHAKGKNVLVLDDIISTGGTMAKAMEKSKENGAKNVFAAATHGIFAGDSMELLNRIARGVVTTDSIINSTSEVSLAKEIAKVL